MCACANVVHGVRAGWVWRVYVCGGALSTVSTSGDMGLLLLELSLELLARECGGVRALRNQGRLFGPLHLLELVSCHAWDGHPLLLVLRKGLAR